MKKNNQITDNIIMLICFCAIVIYIVFLWANHRINYVINDDLTMRDIASGTRGGNPDGHLIYIKYVLGFVLSSLYTYIPIKLDWYGIFMVGMLIFCLCLIAFRIITSYREISTKICILLWVFLIFITHIYEIQWTMCSVLIGLTGVFFYVTVPANTCKRARVVQNIIFFFCMLLCYMIRDKIFWIVLVCGILPVIIKNMSYIRRVDKVIKSVVAIFASILIGIVFIELVEAIAYDSKEWDYYFEFNRERSRVFDYYGIPDYSIHSNFYKEAGISETTYINLKRYGFIYDTNINCENLKKIANYSQMHNVQNTFFDNIKDYTKLMLSDEFGFLIISMVVFCIMIVVLFVKGHNVYGILCCGEIIIWLFVVMYLIFKGRFPQRIIYSLCVVFVFSFFSIFFNLPKNEYSKKIVMVITIIMVFLTGIMISYLNNESRKIREYNITYDQIKEYVKNNSEQLYFLPIGAFSRYTDTVDFISTEEASNLLPTGGWASQTPIIKDKMKMYGVIDIPEDIVEMEAYVLYWSEYSVKYISTTLTESLNKNVGCRLVDEFDTKDGKISVYKIMYD